MDESPAPDEHLARLMARAQQGDSSAYVTLLRAITPRVRQLVRARRGLLSESDVEDVVQDVFVRLWDHPERFEPNRGSLRAYLLTLAYGRSVDVARSETARHRRWTSSATPLQALPHAATKRSSWRASSTRT